MIRKSRDELTNTTKEGKIELREEELNRVAAGTALKVGDALKIKFSTI